uniref:LRRCT domain-containing protein n=1 Tax=Syphacia muris TaxID=451379 RepID=A0A0N5ALN3_9BILA
MYFLIFAIVNSVYAIIIHGTPKVFAENARISSSNSDFNYLKNNKIPDGVIDYFYWRRNQSKWFSCLNDCDCMEDETNADITVSCYSGNMNQSSLTRVIRESPMNLTSLIIEAPETKPNRFFWDDNLNRFHKLRVLRLINCGIPALSHAIRLPQLETLDLRRNKIERISFDMFTDLPNLKAVDLSANQLRVLPTGVFGYLMRLENLSLAYNNITELPINLLHDKQHFRSLHLDGNKISIKNLNDFFRDIQHLERLELNYCELETIDKLSLNSLKQLQRVGLAGNMIDKIPIKLLQDLSQLRTLDLNDNEIERITAVSSANWTGNLRQLFLAHNKLSFREDFKNIADYGTVEELDLSYNDLKTFSSADLGALQSVVKVLHLSGNQLMNIQQCLTQNLTALRVLHLADNGITDLPHKLPEEFAQLTVLNISQNGIYHLPYTYQQFPALKQLDISKNRFFSLHLQFETFLNHLDEVYLYKNPWDCGCNTDALKRHMSKRYNIRQKLRYDDTKCMTPESLRGTLILNLDQITDCAVLFGARYGFTQATELGVLVALLLAITLLISLIILFVYYKREQRQKVSSCNFVQQLLIVYTFDLQISYMDSNRSHSRTALTQLNRSSSSTTEPLTPNTSFEISSKICHQSIPPPPPPPLLSAY